LWKEDMRAECLRTKNLASVEYASKHVDISKVKMRIKW
jgi:hypothetical protein